MRLPKDTPLRTAGSKQSILADDYLPHVEFYIHAKGSGKLSQESFCCTTISLKLSAIWCGYFGSEKWIDEFVYIDIENINSSS